MSLQHLGDEPLSVPSLPHAVDELYTEDYGYGDIKHRTFISDYKISHTYTEDLSLLIDNLLELLALAYLQVYLSSSLSAASLT